MIQDYVPLQKHLPGLLFTSIFALASMYLASLPFFQSLSISALIISIVLGIVYGNVLHHKMSPALQAGITYSLKKVLRIAIVLLGFRITYQQIYAVGPTGIFADAVMMITTFLLAMWLGIKMFKIDRDTSILVGSGSSICGASAVLATEGVLASETHKAALAVATVTIFGTISMFLYPIMYKAGFFPGLDDNLFGVYVGASVHEVAQVVAAGFGISTEAGETATIVKLTRVMMLAPLLIVLSIVLSKLSAKATGLKTKASFSSIPIPWFVFVFILISGFNSLDLIGASAVAAVNEFDTFLLAIAMTALGIETNLSKIKNAGLKPIYLATILFAWLMVGGYFVTLLADKLFG
jgi:uncharacterized integral membrane protein (TIGR00698 family)